jgi:uncharacterized membrane protein
VKALKALSAEDRAELKKAIGRAEMLTSGEIRVFIEDSSEDGPLDRAAFLFNELGMNKTALHNGVLIYVDFLDRKFAIIGDKGIHEKVGDTFWDAIRKTMEDDFRQGFIAKGLIHAVDEAGKALSKYFPRSSADRNELSDDIIFGKDTQ